MQIPTYGRWPAELEVRPPRLSAHEHALCAFADAAACDAAARRLQRADSARPHCRRLRPDAMERRLRQAIDAQAPSITRFGRSAGAIEGLMPLVREGCHWLLVRVDGPQAADTLARLRRALRGEAARCALLFSALAVEDLLPPRKRRARPGLGSTARGRHRGGSSPPAGR